MLRVAERILSVVVKRGRAAWGLEAAKGGVARPAQLGHARRVYSYEAPLRGDGLR